MKKVMKNVSKIFLILTLLFTLYSCGAEANEHEEKEESTFTVKIRINDLSETDVIYPPKVAKDKYFNETFRCLDFNIDGNVYTYKYTYEDEILLDKVYMGCPLLFDLGEKKSSVIKLAEGAIIKNSEGKDWFTIICVEKSVAEVGFDGNMHIRVSIKVHEGQFPKKMSIIANEKYYHYDTSFEKYPNEIGIEKDGIYDFIINIFDAKSGLMFLSVGDTELNWKKKENIEILDSEVEVVLTEHA